MKVLPNYMKANILILDLVLINWYIYINAVPNIMVYSYFL